MSGCFTGIGLGLGNPELITIKALKTLKQSQLIVYPYTSSIDKSLARNIAKNSVDKKIPELFIKLPLRKTQKEKNNIYNLNADIIAQHLKQNKNVAYACIGDPMFYGSFVYLCQRLAKNFKIKTIPGINAFSAAACASGLPLAINEQGINIIPATLCQKKICLLLKTLDNMVIMKIGKHFERIKKILEDNGFLDKAIFVSNLDGETQKIAALKEISRQNDYLSLILISKNLPPDRFFNE